uniref:Uncharacterized protein n=1 Tax=Anopheles funestus TaxID=62324 RepID=A0A182S0S7_ANOFN
MSSCFIDTDLCFSLAKSVVF